MNVKQHMLVWGLLVLVFISSVSVVYITHYQRKLFTRLQLLQADKDMMNVEWGKLQLEENTVSSTSNIEKEAKDKLNMIVPISEKIIFIKLK